MIWAANSQLNVGATLTVQGSGIANLSNQSDQVNTTVTLINGLNSSAQLMTGTGTLTINIAAYLTETVQAGTFGNTSPVIVSGNLALNVAGAATATRTINTGTTIGDVDMRITANIVDGSVNVQNILTAGTGRLELSPTASTFGGLLTVGAGRTRLGTSSASSAATGNVQVNNGFTLELTGGLTFNESLAIANTGATGGTNAGFGGTGALRSLDGNNVWSGPITLGTSNFTSTIYIGVDDGLLDLQGAIGQFGAAAQGILKLLPGALKYSGSAANTYAGNTGLIEGTLRLGKAAGVNAVAAGTLNISGGNDFGGQDADVLILDNDEQIAPAVLIQVSTSGLWDLNGHTETIGNPAAAAAVNVLTIFTGLSSRAHISGGTINIAGGTTVSTNNIAVTPAGGGFGASMLYNSLGGLIESDLNLGGIRRDFNVATAATGFTQNALEVSGRVTNGQINRTGASASTLVLTNAANNLISGADEVQSLNFNGTITGGTFTISYPGLTTAAITYSNVPATLIGNIQTALNGIFGAGNTLVAGSGNSYTVAFQGALAKANLATLTATSSLTGTNTSISIAVLSEGGGNEVQTFTLAGTGLGGTFTVTVNGVGANATTGAQAFNVTAAALQTAIGNLASVGTGNVTVLGSSGTTGGVYTLVFRNALAGVNIVAPVATSSLTGTTPTITPATVAEAFLGDETQTLTYVAGTANYTLTFRGATTAPLAYNATVGAVQAALESLPTIGSGNVQVTGVTGGVVGINYNVTFRNALGGRNVPLLVSSIVGQYAVGASTLGGAIFLQNSTFLAIANNGALGGA